MTAADLVLEKLKARKVTPSALASHLGVDRSLASLMLNNKRGIPVWHLDSIAALVGLTLPELFIPIDPACHPGMEQSGAGETPDAISLARIRREYEELRRDVFGCGNTINDIVFDLIDKYNLLPPGHQAGQSAPVQSQKRKRRNAR